MPDLRVLYHLPPPPLLLFRQSSSLFPTPASSRDSHEALNRRPPSRTCIVEVHASLRRLRPTDQTPNSLLSSPPPSPTFSLPCLTLVHLRARRLAPSFTRSVFALPSPLAPLPSHSLFLSLPLPAFPATSSRRRRAKLARCRVGQWCE